MIYIIDGNNLAGQLNLLSEPNFNQILIDKLKHFQAGRNSEIFLVFDSLDTMGDKEDVGDNITVIYSPRDSYYTNADDKIIEIAQEHFNKSSDELTIITNDLELINKISFNQDKDKHKLHITRASEFAEKLEDKIKTEEPDKEVLNKEEKNNITEELFDLWVNK